ncbi:helix-turn-helix domain-containing protein [Citrifermentans bremense]|uniref:Transcriptional regulator n=1 Tax=Citrifermentans bremense TaxID=60035 RepID=A0A6S6M7X4_9BACT
MNQGQKKKPRRSQVVDAKVFVDRVKLLMEGKGLTSSELADRADLARSAMTLFFAGERKPSADAVVKLAQALGASTDFLLGVSDESKSEELLQHPKVAELVRLFLSLSAKEQDRILEMVRLFCKTSVD